MIRLMYFRVPSRLVSLAAFAQARITLRSPIAPALHPLLRRLVSYTPMHQSCSLEGG